MDKGCSTDEMKQEEDTARIPMIIVQSVDENAGPSETISLRKKSHSAQMELLQAENVSTFKSRRMGGRHSLYNTLKKHSMFGCQLDRDDLKAIVHSELPSVYWRNTIAYRQEEDSSHLAAASRYLLRLFSGSTEEPESNAEAEDLAHQSMAISELAYTIINADEIFGGGAVRKKESIKERLRKLSNYEDMEFVQETNSLHNRVRRLSSRKQVYASDIEESTLFDESDSMLQTSRKRIMEYR